MVACKIRVSAPVPFPFLWTLDFGFGTWIWDLDLGLRFGTGLGLDNYLSVIINKFQKSGFDHLMLHIVLGSLAPVLAQLPTLGSYTSVESRYTSFPFVPPVTRKTLERLDIYRKLFLSSPTSSLDLRDQIT